jgi:hypothetical protein
VIASRTSVTKSDTASRDSSWELVREWTFGKANRLKEDAGLADGGYKA